MKSKKNIKKLEFNKETIARLGEMELGRVQGGTAGTGPSVAIANQCTLTMKTMAHQYTCNIKICKEKQE